MKDGWIRPSALSRSSIILHRTIQPEEVPTLATLDILEALIFASDEPLSLRRITEILQIHANEGQELLQQLKVQKETSGGLTLVAIAEGYRFMTKPEYGDFVAKLREPKVVRLSKAALEVLAIVAYRQPITHAEVDHIRGVDSGHSLKTLVERDLIFSPGRKEAPGRPLLYATTPEFLDFVAVPNLEELPELEEPDALDEPIQLFRRREEELAGEDPPIKLPDTSAPSSDEESEPDVAIEDTVS